MYFAHSVENRSKNEWQRLKTHLEQVGTLAESFAKTFGAQRAAALAGQLHDLGKYSAAFQARLEGSSIRVDHATAGARHVLETVEAPGDKLIAELIAYVIAGHHTGLPDKIGDASLSERLKRPLEKIASDWQTEIAPDFTNLYPSNLRFEKDIAAFQLAFWGRMLFSCLVDADRRDTEAFCAKVEGWTPDRHWPALNEIVYELLETFNAHMEGMRTKATDTPLNHLRRAIFDYARKRATDAQGLFTLTVPTGGGKTLTSLAFALDHAKVHGLDRIIFAITAVRQFCQDRSVGH